MSFASPCLDAKDFFLWLLIVFSYVRRYWRQLAARNWPLADGHIESAQSRDAGEGMQAATQGALLHYSYQVAGEFYGGSALARLTKQDLENDFLLRIKDQPIKISYDPGNPDESTITPEQLEIVRMRLSSTAANPEPLGRYALALPLRILVGAIMACSAIALALAFLDHLAALIGHPLLPPGQFGALYILAFAFALPVALTRLFLHFADARITSPVPENLRRLVFFCVGLSSFYYLSPGFIDPQSATFPRQVMCSFAELFFAGMIELLYPALTARKQPGADEQQPLRSSTAPL